MQELTEEEQRTLRTGLRMLARMIARHHLAVRATGSARENPERESAGVIGAGGSGDER